MKARAVFVFCLAVMATLAAPAPAAPNPAERQGTVYIIPIREVIDDALLYIIRRGLNEAQAGRADAIVFDMDTPGGRLSSAEEILNLLRGLTVPTYTLVNPNSISAGAIIAMGTDHIYMTPGSKIGDAMPIMISFLGDVQPMPESIEEKSVSYVAAMIRAAAQHKGHDAQLAEAMVRRDTEYKIDDDVISKKGRLLTLTNKDAERLVGPDKHPLLSEGTVANLDELLVKIGRGNAVRVELKVTAAEKIARFIESFSVILLALGLLGLYIEFKTPGVILPGVLGVVFLAIWFWGYKIAGLAGNEEIALFILGLALILVELFFIPGFGFTGIAGIFLVVASILMAMIEHYPGQPRIPTLPSFKMPVFKLSAALILSGVAFMILARFLPKSRVFQRLVLQTSTNRKDGFTASTDTHYLVGRRGVAQTRLRPAGVARFDDLRLNVVTRGDFLEAGEEIVIAESHGNRIIVEKFKPS